MDALRKQILRERPIEVHLRSTRFLSSRDSSPASSFAPHAFGLELLARRAEFLEHEGRDKRKARLVTCTLSSVTPMRAIRSMRNRPSLRARPYL